MSRADAPDAPDIAARPPVSILGALLVASVAELLLPLGPGLAQGNYRAIGLGLAIALLGSIVVARAHRRLIAFGNAVSARRPAAALVTTGVYAWSRNPVYVGLILVYFGLALALTTVWGMVLLPVAIAALGRGAILPEEAYLERRFGDAYRAYARKVPRWL